MSTEIPDTTTAADRPAPTPEVRDRHAELSQLIAEHRWRYYMGSSTSPTATSTR
jgi:DNA ligase (NAD+)